MREMVIEPGTGWLVHKSFSDGQWSIVEHPLNNMGKYLRGKSGDPFPVDNARPERSWVEPIVHRGKANIGGIGLAEARAGIVLKGSASVSGVGTATALALLNRLASASVSGTGSASALGIKAKYASASVSGVGSTSAIGLGQYKGFASIQGIGTITETATAPDWLLADWNSSDWETS